MRAPFTDRQLAFLHALQAKLRELSDPESETRRTFEWTTVYSSAYGYLPMVRFQPYGQTNDIKKEVLENAGLFDREKHNARRAKLGLPAAKNAAANTFDTYLHKLAAKWKRALMVTAFTNKFFAPAGCQVAPPVEMLQRIIMSEYGELSRDIQPIHADTMQQEPQPGQGGSYWEELQEAE